MSSYPVHGVHLTSVFMFLATHLASPYYFVSEVNYNWTSGLDRCRKNGMRYLDARSPKAAENASRYLGVHTESRYWSGLRYDDRKSSFLMEGSEGTVEVSNLKWAPGEPNANSINKCATYRLKDNNAVYKMANCSQYKAVICEGRGLTPSDTLRGFSRGSRQKKFCEQNQDGIPVCTFYKGHDWEIQLLEVKAVDAEEDCALLCMEMSKCVHFTYIRKSARVGTCLIHGEPFVFNSE